MYYEYLPLLLLLIVCGTAVAATKDLLLLENDPSPPAAEKKKSSKEKEKEQEAHDPEAERKKMAKEKEAKMTELFFKFKKNSGACIENFLSLLNKHMGADERAHWGAEITPADKETNFSFFSTFRKNFIFDHDENLPKLKKFDMHQDLRFKLYIFEAFRYSFTPNGHVLPKDMAKIAFMLNWQEYIRFKTLPLTEDKWKKWKFIDYFKTDKRNDVYLCDLLSIAVSHSSTKKKEKREDEIKRMDSRAPSSSYSASHSYSHRQGSLHRGQSQRIPAEAAAGSAAGKFGSISLRSEFRKMFIKESSNLNKTKLNSILSRWETVDRYKYWNGICSKNGKLDSYYGRSKKELILKTFQKFAGNFMSKQGFQVYQHMRKYFNDEEWPIVKNIIYPALEFYIHRGQQLFDAANLSEFPLLLLICCEQWENNKGELSVTLLETKLANERESKNKAKRERKKIESLNAQQMLPNVGMAWQGLEDANDGRKYYLNFITGESTWTPPSTKEVWQELTVPQDGRKYYSNFITKESTWTPHKITEVWQGLEDENDGRKYYLNSITGEKTSTPPDVDEAWRELAVPNNGGGGKFYFNSITRESTWTKPAALLEKEEKQYLYTYAVENFKPAWLEEPIVTQQGGEFYRMHFYEFDRLESSLFFVPVHQMDHHHVRIMLDAQKYWSDWSWPDVKAVKPKAIGGLFDQPFLDALIAAKTANIFRFKYLNKKGKWHFHINEDYIRGIGAGTIPAAHGHIIPEYRYSMEYTGYSNYEIDDNAKDVINGSFGQWLYQAWNAAEINKTKPLKFGVEILSRIFRRLLDIDEAMSYYHKNSQHLHQNQRLNFNFDALFDWVARMLAQCLALNETSIKEEEGREKQEQHCVVGENGHNKSLLDKNLLFEKMQNINVAPKHSSSRSSSVYFAMLANSDACIERFDIFRNLWFFDVDKRFSTNFGQDLLNTIEISGRTTCNFKMAHQIEAMFGSMPKRSGQPMKELFTEMKKFLGSDVCKEFFGTVDTKVWMHAEGRMEMLFAALASRRNDSEHMIGDERGKHMKLGQYEVKQNSVAHLAAYILLSAIYYLNRLLRETLLEDSLNGTRKFLAIEMNWEEEGGRGVVKHEGNESKQVHNTINGFKMLERLKERLNQLKEHIRFLNERQREHRDRYNRDYHDTRVKVNALRAITLKPNLLNAKGKSIIEPTLSDVATWMERVHIAEQRLNNVFIKMSMMAKKMKIKKIAKKLLKIEKKKGKKGNKHRKRRERTELTVGVEFSSSSSSSDEQEEGIFSEGEAMEEINWDEIFPEDYSGNGGFFALFNENIDDNSGDPLFTLFNAKDDDRAETIYYAMDAFYRIGELAEGGDGVSGVADAFGNFVNGIFDDSTANAHMFGGFLAGNVGDLTSGIDLSNALTSFDGSSAMTNVDWGNMLEGFGAVIKGIFSDVGKDVGDAFGSALKGLGNLWDSLTTSDSSSSSSSYTSSSNWSPPSSSSDSDWLSNLFDWT